jgi:hypothetical protein
MHPFGGHVIEGAAILAEGSGAAAVIASILARARVPERSASARGDQGLHACRLRRGGEADSKPPLRFVLRSGTAA